MTPKVHAYPRFLFHPFLFLIIPPVEPLIAPHYKQTRRLKNYCLTCSYSAQNCHRIFLPVANRLRKGKVAQNVLEENCVRWKRRELSAQVMSTTNIRINATNFHQVHKLF